jgi:multidrug efflux system outer membrane protein
MSLRHFLCVVPILAAASLGASESEPPVLPPTIFEAPLHFKNASPAPSDAKAGPILPSGKPDPAWWKIFNDPALNALEEQATAANQDLARALARIEEARARPRSAAADFFPSFALQPSAQRLRTTNTGPKGKAQILGNAGNFGALLGGSAGAGNASVPAFVSRGLSTTYNDFRAPLTLNYEVDIFGRIRHNYASARANQGAVEADRRAVALSLGAEVATSYFALRALDSEVAVLRGSVNLRRDSVQINRERVTNGVANPLDLSRAQVELSTTQADLEDILRQRDETENRLAELSGQPASNFRLPSRPLETLRLPVIPAGVPSDLLVRRPDLAEAERRLAVATEGIGAVRAKFLPTFNIQGNAGFESSVGNRLFDAENRELSILGAIRIPIFEGGRNAADLRAARARRDESLAAYRASALTALREVENALSALRRSAAQLEAREQAKAAADDVFDRSQKRYIEGAVNYFEVVDAQRSMLGAEISRVQTLNSRFGATIDLIRALGGDWIHPLSTPASN